MDRVLQVTADRHPDGPAIIAGERSVTWSCLERDVAAFARGLLARGVRTGDRVAIVLENSVEACVAILGCMRAGAVFVALNPKIQPIKLRALVSHCRARAIVAVAQDLELVSEGTDADQVLFILLGEGPGGHPVPYELLMSGHAGPEEDPAPDTAARVSEEDLATLVYTSGTTGRPKAVMHSRRNISSVVSKIATYLDTDDQDVILSVLPLSFGYGLTQLFTSVHSGACLVLEPGMGYPAALLLKVERHGVTVLPVVPTISALLLRLSLETFDLTSLRVITSAGAHLSVEHVDGWRAAVPGAGVFNMYGLTECIRASFLHPRDAEEHPGSIGRGLPGQEWGLFADDGEPAAEGEVGELVLASDHLMTGYWEDQEMTDRVLRPNPMRGSPFPRALYTGDLFCSDAGGYMSFVSRRDDMINTRGEMVSPEEVEGVLLALPGIMEAVVFGRTDSILGASIRACVVVADHGAPSEAEILRHCAAHLEDYMVPQAVEFRQSLPRTPSGKIARAEWTGVQEAIQ